MDVLEAMTMAMSPGAPFEGTYFKEMVVLLKHISPHDTMRISAEGSISKTQLRILERNFRDNHNLSAAQYMRMCLLQLCSQSDMADA